MNATHPAAGPARITVIGGGLAGLVAAVTAAEQGVPVTLHESHHTLGGRARTAEGPYRTNDGPHALYKGGPLWTWLGQRNLLRPVTAVPLKEGAKLRFHRGGELRRTPPLAVLRLARRKTELAPVDQDFLTWATSQVGEEGARAATHYIAVALYHHDPGALSAAFVQERLRRGAALPPEAHFLIGGWSELITRLTDRATGLGVRIETGSRVDTLPTGGGPVIVATTLASARRLLGDTSLTGESGRTTLLDLGLRKHRKDVYAVSDLEAPGWIERFTAQDPTLAPAGEELVQAQLPIAPHETKADGVAHAERLLDLGFPGWRERVTYRKEAVSNGRTGAVDRPGATWRDRPAIDRGGDVYLAGDEVAAPGLLSEVSFNSALQAATLAIGRVRSSTGGLRTGSLDLKRA